jgi:hypothetical protein
MGAPSARLNATSDSPLSVGARRAFLAQLILWDACYQLKNGWKIKN